MNTPNEDSIDERLRKADPAGTGVKVSRTNPFALRVRRAIQSVIGG